jgi:hypothetical protein
MGQRYQRLIVPVSAFYDGLSAFCAFLIKKSVSGQASVGGRRLAGQLLENSAETGLIGKTEEDGYFGHALGAGAEKVLGLRDPAAVEIIVIGQAHHLLKYSGKVCGRHSGLPGNGVEANIGPVVVVDKTNCLLDLIVLTGGDSGIWHFRLGGLIGPGKDVLSALFIRVPEGEIEVDLRGKLGHAEGLLEIIAGAVSESLDRHLLVAVSRYEENENGGFNVFYLFHSVDAGHVGQLIIHDNEIDVASPFHHLDRDPAALGRDNSIGVGKTLDITLEESGIVVNDQYPRRFSVSHGGWTRFVSALPAIFHVMVTRWFIDHGSYSAHPSVQTP